MAISLLKRYKNEIYYIIKKTESYIDNEVDYDWSYINFFIKSPYDREVGVSVHLYFSKSINYKNNLKAIEEGNLVYVGLDMKNFVSDMLNYSFNVSTLKEYKKFGLDGFVASYFVKMILFDRERLNLEAYSDSHDGLVEGYQKSLILKDFQRYVDEGLYVAKRADGHYVYFHLNWRDCSRIISEFIIKILNSGEIKSLDYFKTVKNELENLSSMSISLADGEYPDLSDRNFLPIVVTDFSKDKIFYLSSERYISKKGSYPAYKKGRTVVSVNDYIGGKRNVYIPTNSIQLDYNGSKFRSHEVLQIKVTV